MSAKMSGMTELMESKFDGVHRRQDIANGRTAKAEMEIMKLKEDLATVKANIINLDAKETAHIRKSDNRTWDVFKVFFYFLTGIIGFLGTAAFNKLFI